MALGRVTRISSMKHGATVEALGLIPDPAGQNRQMARPLASVHEVGMTPRLRQAPLKHRVNVLTKLGLARHLYEIVGVQADETLFDHLRVFSAFEGRAVWWPVTGRTFLRAVLVRGRGTAFGAAVRFVCSASIKGRRSEAARTWVGNPNCSKRSAFTRKDDRSASLIRGSFSARDDMGGSVRTVGAAQTPPLELVQRDLGDDLFAGIGDGRRPVQRRKSPDDMAVLQLHMTATPRQKAVHDPLYGDGRTFPYKSRVLRPPP